MVSIVIATSKIKIKVPTGIHHSKKIYEIYFNIQKAALVNWVEVVKKDNGSSTGPAHYVLWAAFTLCRFLISSNNLYRFSALGQLRNDYGTWSNLKKNLVRVVGVKVAGEGGEESCKE